MSTPITELDFDQIKTGIIDYIKTNPAFTDYNFEGSALNAIIDILAYNTHTNAYYANMLHSEGFLDTAQKRSSVVSRAKELGYTPKSTSGSIAYVDITLSNLPDAVPYFSLPRGSIFTSSNDSGSYSFVVVEDNYSVLEGSVHKFKNVKLVCGKLTYNSFTVNTISNIRSIFNIPNKSVDTTTLKVYVRDSYSSLDRTEYTRCVNVLNTTSTSNVFFLQESYDGFFQIYFGEDILGTQPVNGNIIEISYLVSNELSNSDECSLFYFEGSTDGTISGIQTTQVSYGGSDKESLESVKYNAKLSNAAKNRSVTVSDYEIQIKTLYPDIKSVSIWGGEDNDPPIYGKVFISLQPVSGYTISDYIKTNVILPELRKTSVISITPVLLDPSYTDLEFATTIKFNSNKTISNKTTVENAVLQTISTYVSEISKFNSDYLETELISKIVEVDPGISSVDIKKKIGFRLTPYINTSTSHYKNLNNAIVPGTITSSKFYIYNVTKQVVSIAEIPDSLNNNLTSLGLYDSNGVLVQTIGTVNLNTGIFDFSFVLDSYVSATRYINIRCSTVNQDISTTRNQILTLNDNTSDVSVGILSNNTVTTIAYVK